MKSRTLRIGSLLAFFATTVFVQGCKKTSPAQAATPEAPSGEVWLTPVQLKEAQVAVESVAEQDVEDTILTSGRVAFDDARVAHVYSPVSGKVTKIEAQ